VPLRRDRHDLSPQEQARNLRRWQVVLVVAHIVIAAGLLAERSWLTPAAVGFLVYDWVNLGRRVRRLETGATVFEKGPFEF
jgi:hypothetical protein